MKKWVKVLLGIGVGATLLGATLAAYGFATGGVSDLTNAKKISTKVNYKKMTLDTFKNITLDSDVSDVIITKSDIDKPFISYSTETKSPLTHEIKDGTLKVSQKSSQFPKSRTVINFFDLSDLIGFTQNGQITTPYTILISVPRDTNLNSVKTNLKAGSLSLGDITIADADFELSAGDLDIENTTINSGHANISAGSSSFDKSSLTKFSLTANAGEVDFENSTADQSNFKLNMGDFSANDMTFKGTNTLNIAAGDTDITLASKNLKVKLNNSLGDADITDQLNQSSPNTLTIKSSMGDISIQ